MYNENEVICPQCPSCGSELGDLCGEYYCFRCSRTVSNDSAVLSKDSGFDDDYGYEEPDYGSMVNNGDEICLNCTYWSVSPYGRSHGMVCRKGQLSDGPNDSCEFFIPESHFASYGDEGQFQFDETGRAIENKLYSWKNSRF